MKALYLLVSHDQYELPLAVAESPYELAAMTGKSIYAILHAVNGCVSKGRFQRPKKSQYVKVWVDENEL